MSVERTTFIKRVVSGIKRIPKIFWQLGIPALVALLAAYIQRPIPGDLSPADSVEASQSPVQNVNADHKSTVMTVSGSSGVVQTTGPVLVVNSDHKQQASRQPMTNMLAKRQELDGQQLFFSLPFGAIAIAPEAASFKTAQSAGRFLVLSPQRVNEFVPFSSRIWLRFNHYLPESNGLRRHLGVFVVTFDGSGASVPLQVYRNKNWVRSKTSPVLPEFSEVLDMPWNEFVSDMKKWSKKGADLSDVDKKLKGPWHAIPKGGDISSWEYRKFWAWAVARCQESAKDVFGDKPDFTDVKVSARLIGFTPCSRKKSKSPVLFDINLADKEGASVFLAVYAFGDSKIDTREWYWIKFRENE